MKINNPLDNAKERLLQEQLKSFLYKPINERTKHEIDMVITIFNLYNNTNYGVSYSNNNLVVGHNINISCNL